MPDVIELGRRVKAKYPGEYDDLSDADLGAKVKAKHPEYSDFTDVQAQPAPGGGDPTTGDLLKTSGKEFLKTVNPVAVVADAAKAIISPRKTFENVKAAQGSEFDKAKASFRKGYYGDAVTHGMAGLLPGVGPLVMHTAEALGLTNEQSDKKEPVDQEKAAKAFGQFAGVGAMAIAPDVISKVRGSSTFQKVRDSLKSKPTPTNAVDDAAVAFADAEGIPIPAGTRTGNKAVKGAQALSASSPLGAPIARKAMRNTEAALQSKAAELAEQTGPSATAESAGAGIRSKIEQRISRLKNEADQAYEGFRQIEADPKNIKQVQTGARTETSTVLDAQGQPITRQVPITQDIPLPVDIRPVKEALAPIYEDMQKWMEPAKRNASAGYQAIKSILESDDHIPASQAEKGLGGLKTLARADNADLRNVNQGIGAKAVTELQSAIDSAVSQTPGAMQALSEGRAAHASKMAVADVLNQIREEPVQAFNQAIWKNDTGIERLREIQKYAPGEMKTVGRAFVEQLFDKTTEDGGISKTQGVLSKWRSLGPETKKILFPDPVLRDRLNNFLVLANKVAENPNPSGSAVVGQLIPGAGLMVANPAAGGAWLLGGAATAKLLYSPNGIKLLKTALTLPKRTPMGAATAGKILQIAGDDVRPIAADKQDGKPSDRAAQ